jgi:putative NADH-flavin reductase
MEDLVQGSDLDWTIMRPPSLINRRLRGSYRVALGRNVRGGVFIARADVAHGMLDAVHRPETIGQTIGIAY